MLNEQCVIAHLNSSTPRNNSDNEQLDDILATSAIKYALENICIK